MPSPPKTTVTPDGLDSQRKLRRLMLGGSVGTSLLLALSVAWGGSGETAPAAAAAAASPYADSLPAAETYPIPAQAGADKAIPYAVADKDATRPSRPEPTAPGTADSDANRAGRNNVVVPFRATAAPPDNHAPRGRGAMASSAPNGGVVPRSN
jgi:hypothetical protein